MYVNVQRRCELTHRRSALLYNCKGRRTYTGQPGTMQRERAKKTTNKRITKKKKTTTLIEIRFCPLIAHIAGIDNSLERCQHRLLSDDNENDPHVYQWYLMSRVTFYEISQQVNRNILTIISICFSVRQSKTINGIKGITKIKYSSL